MALRPSGAACAGLELRHKPKGLRSAAPLSFGHHLDYWFENGVEGRVKLAV